MTFVSPWTALLAAAIAIPLLLLMYVLKLRRRRLGIASTLLWTKSSQDLEANVPFQKLRFSILLLLQLLLLAALLFALGDPVMNVEADRASRVILLIDRSASMNTIETSDDEVVTRLGAAKDGAKRLVKRLLAGGGRQVMIIAVDARPRTVSGFESRPDVLIDAIDALAPTDDEADLGAALRLAGVFSSRGEDDLAQPPDVIFISDGGVAPPDPPGFSLRGGRFQFMLVESERLEPVHNVGIVAFTARRDHRDPTRVLVFARLINVGPEPVSPLVTLLIDGEPGPVKPVIVPPPAESETSLGGPGEATVTFSLDLPTGAVLSLHQSVRDMLVADDTAAVVLPSPAAPRVALVHAGDGADAFLRDFLEAFGVAALSEMSREAFDVAAVEEIDLGRRFDLVVFDRTAPARLPGVPTLMFGAAPPGIEIEPGDEPGGARILSWDRQHPVMRHVSLDTIVYAGFSGFVATPALTPLARGPRGAVIVLLSARGAQHLAVGFELERSNWPLHISAAVFVKNAVDYLTLARSGHASLGVRPGQPITVRVSPDVEEVVIWDGGRDASRAAGGPSQPITVRATPGALMNLPELRRAGVYRVQGVEPPHERVAVSMLSDVESDVRARRELVINTSAAVGGEVADSAPRHVGVWFIGIALGLLVVEWLAYCRQLRV